MFIMESNNERLITAMVNALDDVLHGAGGKNNIDSCLVCDCYTRMLALEEQYDEALHTMKARIHRHSLDIRPQGALVLGEIASDGESSLEYYNKTFVINILHDTA